MSNAGDRFRTDAGEAFFNLVTPTLPAALFMAAFTDSVDAVGAGTEVADPASNTVNYARAALPATAFNEVSPGVFALTNDLLFNQAQGGAWGTIVSLALVAVATGAMTGQVIAFDDVTLAKQIDEFDTLRIPGGTAFTLTIV